MPPDLLETVDESDNEPEAVPRDPPTLEELQLDIMQALAEADGGARTIDEVARALGISYLRVEQASERLEAFGYVRVMRQTSDPYVDLTRRGRDYAIEKGLA